MPGIVKDLKWRGQKIATGLKSQKVSIWALWKVYSIHKNIQRIASWDRHSFRVKIHLNYFAGEKNCHWLFTEKRVKQVLANSPF